MAQLTGFAPNRTTRTNATKQPNRIELARDCDIERNFIQKARRSAPHKAELVDYWSTATSSWSLRQRPITISSTTLPPSLAPRILTVLFSSVGGKSRG